MKEILCSISTKGRYDTTLPLAIQAVAMQTLRPDELIIFDDNDQVQDIRDIQHYHYLLRILDERQIKWRIIFGKKLGQHHNHQMANTMGYEWVWRVDDDCVPEPDVLEKLFLSTKNYPYNSVGAVGGSILTPPYSRVIGSTGKIEDIKSEANLQWDIINETKEVDHLHCSFLYRAGIVDYDLNLSRIAHREETLFTYKLKKVGYKILLTPCITWHLKNKDGGIRQGTQEMFRHDEQIFDDFLKSAGKETIESKLIVLDNGIGDHYSFKNILPELRKKYPKITLAVCYPDVFHDEPDLRLISIAEAINMGEDLDRHSIYKWMVDHRWNESMVEAFIKKYL